MITQIALNLKNVEADIEVTSNCILLLGHNGAGKTAILNAVELACNDEALDVGGRSSAKSKAMIQDILPAGGGYARVGFANGDRGSWGEQLCPVWFVWPEVNAALSGSKDKFLDFMVRHMLWDEVNETVRLEPPAGNPSAVELFCSLRDLFNANEDPLVVLLGIKHHADKNQRFFKKSSEELTNAASLIRSYDADEALILDMERDADEKMLTASHYTVVSDTCVSLLERAVDAHRDRISLAVRRFGVNFGFEFRGRSVFCGEVQGDGSLRACLSRAQWSIMVTAVAAAVADRASVRCIIVPEDRAYDDDSIRTLCKILRECRSTSFVPSVRQPRGRPITGVQVIDVEGL